MTETEPTVDLPRGVQGGVELCHRCATWRSTEIVHDVDGVPTCEVCDPELAPVADTEDPPRKQATRKRTPARKTATRRARKP